MLPILEAYYRVHPIPPGFGPGDGHRPSKSSIYGVDEVVPFSSRKDRAQPSSSAGHRKSLYRPNRHSN